MGLLKIGLLKIDSKEAVIYQFISKKQENIAYHHEGNWLLLKKEKMNSIRHNQIDEHHYFEKVIKGVKAFKVLIMATHGKGHANEGAKFEAHLYKHHKNMRNIFFGYITTDNHKTENQLLAEADAFLEKLDLKIKEEI